MRIRDVRTIPRRQIIHTVNRSRRKVRNIIDHAAWQFSLLHKLPRQHLRLICRLQASDAIYDFDTFCGCTQIARSDFGCDKLRNEQFILKTLLVPPFPGDLLVGRRQPASCQFRNHRHRNILSLRLRRHELLSGPQTVESNGGVRGEAIQTPQR